MVRRAALEARSYTDESVDSESEQESDFVAVMNSKQVLQQKNNEGEEQESESKNSEVEEDRSKDISSDDDMTGDSNNDSGVVTIGKDT